MQLSNPAYKDVSNAILGGQLRSIFTRQETLAQIEDIAHSAAGRAIPSVNPYPLSAYKDGKYVYSHITHTCIEQQPKDNIHLVVIEQ